MDDNTLPQFAPIPRWTEISGISRRSTYELLAQGKLRAVKNGRRTLIDVQDGIAYLRSLPAATFTLSPRDRRRLDAAEESAA